MSEYIPACECADTSCPQATIVSGHLVLGKCGQPAIMHLFLVRMMVHETAVTEGAPNAFCEPCGDRALQSGAFATSEDVATARREGEWKP